MAEVRKEHLILILVEVRWSLLRVESRERDKITKAATSRHSPRTRRGDGERPYNYRLYDQCEVFGVKWFVISLYKISW